MNKRAMVTMLSRNRSGRDYDGGYNNNANREYGRNEGRDYNREYDRMGRRGYEPEYGREYRSMGRGRRDDDRGMMGYDREYGRDGYGRREYMDERGREHYRDGRYAPERRYEDGDDEYFFKVKGKFGRADEMGSRKMPSKMTRELAEEWTRKMENADGSHGPHWSMEQVKQVQEQKKELQGFELPDVYAALNMMYSDYCEVAKKFNVNNLDFYVCMTKAWLDDDDAGAGSAKTLMYYECVAK